MSAVAPAAPVADGTQGLWSDAWSALLRNRAAMVSALLLFALTVSVVIGPALLPWTFDKPDWDLIAAPPGTGSEGRAGGIQAGQQSVKVTIHSALRSIEMHAKLKEPGVHWQSLILRAGLPAQISCGGRS